MMHKGNSRTNAAIAALLAALLVLSGCGKQAAAPTPEPDSPGPAGALTATVECQDGNPVVNLAWEAVTDADTYSLERDYVVLAELEDAVSYTDAAVANGETHTYRLTAQGAGGEVDFAPVTVEVSYYACRPLGNLVTAGGLSSYAVAADGSLWAWGSNWEGQLGIGTVDEGHGPVQAVGLTGVVSVAAGYEFVIALDADGAVWSFGDNDYGQLGVTHLIDNRSAPGPVDGLPGIVAIAAGEYHALALDADGTVWAWGDNSVGQLGFESVGGSFAENPVAIDGLEDVTAVFAGGDSSYAIHADGTVSAWGSNYGGQLGLGDDVDRLVPEKIPGLTGIITMATNYGFAVLLGEDGDVWAMGDGSYLPNPSMNDELVPVLQPGLDGAVSLEAGYEHVLVVMDDGSVVGWGDNDQRQLIDSDLAVVSPPQAVPGLTDVIAVAAGDNHSLALTADGRVLAWGSNSGFQLGEADITASFEPLPVELPGEATQVSASGHALALLDDGTVWSWGSGYRGELGNDEMLNTGIPQQVQFPAGTVIDRVVAGDGVSFALDTDGYLWSWGSNSYGVLAQPGVTSATVPAKVAGFGPFTDLSYRYWAVLAVDTANNVWSWGFNGYGQLGQGDTVNRTVPQLIPTLGGVAKVASGTYHSAVVLTNGEVWSMGLDDYGQLGNSAAFDPSATAPVQAQVMGAASVAAGERHTLALLTDGTLSAWGQNSHGQLGDDMGGRGLPAAVPGLSDIEQVVAAGNSSLALESDGTVYAWGDNQYGQLGVSGLQTAYFPIEMPVPGGTPAEHIATGIRFSLVVADGQVYATGTNTAGQLGQGRIFRRGEPEAVEGLPTARVP